MRLALVALSPGVITILCHAERFLPTGNHANGISGYLETAIPGTMATDASRAFKIDGSLDWPMAVWGPPPEAKDDFATTKEETVVTIKVLDNDKRGDSGDDDDDDRDFRIDRSTVDLDPDAGGIQSTRSTDHGVYKANSDGEVTFTPSLNFFGNTSLQYTVSSRAGEVSNRATISLTVTNINDIPVIAGLQLGSLHAQAGQAFTLNPTDLIVADPDNHDPAVFTLLVLPGDNYTASGNVMTPHAGFAGVLPVQVQINDGISSSEPYELRFTVTQENTKPVINGQNALSTPEDQAITIRPEDLQVTDPDDNYPADFTIRAGTNENYTVSDLTITPVANYSGTLSVPVIVNDGEADSDPYAVQITVTPVNDTPVITAQSPDPLMTAQDQPLTINLSDLTVTDPDHPDPASWTLTVREGQHYTFTGNTITPAAGFTGNLAVNVTVSDPVQAGEPYPVNVAVTPNTPPVITGQTELTTMEEVPLAITLSNIQVTDPDDSYPAGFTLLLLPGANYTVDGETIVPALDFSGNLSVAAVVNDGTSDSEEYPLQVTVQGVNDAPVIAGQVPLSTPEGQMIALDFLHLVVTDPDNQYPEGFSLTVLGGTNYSVNGNQITPAAGFNGDLTVRVFVNDGIADSEFFDVLINVTPVNDPPIITGQRPLEVAEDTPITLSVQDVTATDPDNTFPDGFTLAVLPGENYTFLQTVVTPSANFTGNLTVNVVVNDGVSNSASFPLQVSVLPVNDAPVITGQQSVTTAEDVARAIALADLVIVDPDHTTFTLTVFAGDNYLLSGSTVTPLQDFSGTLSVPVQVSDGELTSNVFYVSLQVSPVNDAPVITGQLPLTTEEDTPATILLSHLVVLDVDNTYPSGFTLAVLQGVNYSVSGSTVTPSTDFNGTLNVGVVVNDGTSNSASFAFQIQVGDANDAPVITGQKALDTNEENPVTIELSHLIVTDPDNVYPNGFSILVSPGVNYTVSGQTISPAVNFAGTLTVPIRVNDGVNNSAAFDFQLQVNQVNDAPSFAPIANQKIQENTAAGSVTITDISKGPQEDDQQLTFVATSSNTAIIADPVIQYPGTGATASLSYAVKPNASGLVTITIVAIDNGSNTPPHQNSYTSSFQVEVAEVNTAPTLDPVSNLTLLEDAEQQNVTLTGISAGAGETQALSVTVTTSKPEFFDMLEIAYTSPQTQALLQFKTKANISGTVSISVDVTDNGPGVSPHVNKITRTFSVVIQPVNDVPLFTSQPVVIAAVNEPYVYSVTAVDPDGEKVTLSAPVRPVWMSLAGTGNGTATLKGTPPAGAVGNVAVTLEVRDATAAVEQSFSIYVNVRPTLTSLSLATEEDNPAAFTRSFFESGYVDGNGNPLVSVRVMSLPASGKLLLSGDDVKAGDTISAGALSALQYEPQQNFFGMDSFGWNAFDGYHFSSTAARVDIAVVGVNDPPVITFQQDTLQYEVNGEPALISPLADIVDPDDDTLRAAVIGFHARNFHREMDWLQFDNTANIRGSFDFQSGILNLTGVASLEEYRTALRSVRYLHQNTLDPLLEPKALYFIVHDGEVESVPKDKVIILKYTFVEFDIPTGFTPNGDQANDTWIINRPGGLEEMGNAIISVYNKQGVLVFRAKGFERPWDGTMNGDPLPADSYFFTIDLQLRNKKTYKGIVTILR